MRLSKNAKLYRDENDDYETPDWNEVATVQDLTLSESYDEANVTSRDSGGFTEIEPTLNSIELSFSMEMNATARLLLLFYNGRNPVILKVVDGEDDDVGFMGWFKFTSFGRDQNLADSQKINITAKPSMVPADEPLVYFPAVVKETSITMELGEDELQDVLE